MVLTFQPGATKPCSVLRRRGQRRTGSNVGIAMARRGTRAADHSGWTTGEVGRREADGSNRDLDQVKIPGVTR